MVYMYFRSLARARLPSLKSTTVIESVVATLALVMFACLVVQVSCNYEPHLRGNVYVQFST